MDKELEEKIDSEITKLRIAPSYNELKKFALCIVQWTNKQNQILQTLSYQEGLKDGEELFKKAMEKYMIGECFVLKNGFGNNYIDVGEKYVNQAYKQGDVIKLIAIK